MSASAFDNVFGSERGTVLAAGALGRVRVGTRLRCVREVERYPHFVVAEGATAVIADISEHGVCIHLDEFLEGAQEWDNCLILTPEDWGWGLETQPSPADALAAQLQYHFQTL
jgi:hypothetical protein